MLGTLGHTMEFLRNFRPIQRSGAGIIFIAGLMAGFRDNVDRTLAATGMAGFGLLLVIVPMIFRIFQRAED